MPPAEQDVAPAWIATHSQTARILYAHAVNIDQNQPPETQRQSGFVFTLLVALGALALLYHLLFPTISDRPTPASRIRERARNGAMEIREALRLYYSEYQSLPNGSHRQIIAALSGDNPHKIVFFANDWEQIRAAGQFLDPWGVPYQIDTSAPSKPRVYSTGQNKQDDTGEPGSDDVVSWR